MSEVEKILVAKSERPLHLLLPPRRCHGCSASLVQAWNGSLRQLTLQQLRLRCSFPLPLLQGIALSHQRQQRLGGKGVQQQLQQAAVQPRQKVS